MESMSGCRSIIIILDCVAKPQTVNMGGSIFLFGEFRTNIEGGYV